MKRIESSSAPGCCFKEKRRVVEELSICGYCSTSFQEYKRCRREVTSESGERAKACMIG